MPTDAELLERRRDRFEEWWEAQRNDWEPLDPEQRGDLWAICRQAYYAGRNDEREEKRG